MSHIYENLEYTGTVHEGAVWVTTGHHPDLGSIVTIQDEDPKVVIMHSQFPSELPNETPDEAITAH
ncbi:hypothetical protein P7D22_21085 [Lichenihabitans sp. Uapishka_5]|uniref:hypothetical protein n=1 Tax=Lichenihabitans sp. Uapishka_5 TaxID=3037302 RepID=UPI0029E81927|nr:hypothetical protein [Lichenihabitans sp. Uapishka_5]MDX7953663.1 hypothetical protein [Lichenihabitans sp. Uapishka_5]